MRVGRIEGLHGRLVGRARRCLLVGALATVALALCVSRHTCSSTSRVSSRRRACAADVSSSARCSSPTTSRGCATTSGARPRTSRCAGPRAVSDASFR
jgi:hypothetical protein